MWQLIKYSLLVMT